VVGVAETAPRHQVGAGSDSSRGVELQQGQPLHQRHQTLRAISIEQLRPDCDPAGFVDAEFHHHRATL